MDQDDQDRENLVFYYSREKRLARSPRRVRDLYAGRGAKKPSFLGTLIQTRSSAMLLITILLVVVFLFFNAQGRGGKGGAALGGNSLTVSGRLYRGAAYLTIGKKADSPNAYTGPVEIAVSIPQKKGGEAPPVESRRVFFSLAPEERFEFSVPFQAPRLALLLKAGEALASLTIKIDG